MSKSVELRQQRAKYIHDARKILDHADAEKRELTAEEREQWDQLMAEADKREAQAVRLEKQELAEGSLDASLGRRSDPPQPGEKPKLPPTETRERRATDEYRKAFNAYLIGGVQNFGPNEYRALQADSDVLGGALVAPMQFVNQLIKFIDDRLYIRQAATKHTVTEAQSLGMPSLDADPDDAEWTAELSTGAAEDNSMKFGRRELTPRPLRKRIKVSQRLLSLTSGGAETIVRDRLGYKFLVTEEKQFIVGDGANKPLGVAVASNDGIPAARDGTVAAAQLTGNPDATLTDALIDTLYRLKDQYQQRATWLLHRDARKQIRKAKDANQQYIWQPGLAPGEPDTILLRPVWSSEYFNNTYTSGNYVAVCGDFSFYHIADAEQMTVQRLVELYAETGQVGFIGTRALDAMPVLAEAFSRLKIA
jgi:HK97 family phage major capsid protein